MGDEGAKGGKGGRGELVGCLILNSSRPVPSSEVWKTRQIFKNIKICTTIRPEKPSVKMLMLGSLLDRYSPLYFSEHRN